MDGQLVDGLLPAEDGAYPITYAGTKPFDADTDGDGMLDGADDQDFDDIPNIMELSRSVAGNLPCRARSARRARPTCPIEPDVDDAEHLGQPVQPVPAGPAFAYLRDRIP